MSSVTRPSLPHVEGQSPPVEGRPPAGSEVLITGMSGRFPSCNSIKEFKDKLYGQEDMTSPCSDRWSWKHPEVPPRMGMISEMDKFDAQFFGVHFKQSNSMEPMLRKMLECTCEALIDAGVSPRSLRGQKVGVFIGGMLSENEKQWVFSSRKIDGYGLTGTSRAMYANRISYWLGVTAPSYTLDGGDCSGAMALHHAFEAVQSGQCEAAIVGAASFCLHPYRNLNMSRLGLLSLSGESRPFSEDADGYVRSESVTILFLQKAKDAMRGYAQVVHAKTGFTSLVSDEKLDPRYPSGPEMTSFLRDFYKETDVTPAQVSYVEACGIGLRDTDREELEGLEKIYCEKPRPGPLLVGSVKSNMGNSEIGSTLCSLVKVLLSYHTGKIAPNLHLTHPVSYVDSLKTGDMRLVSEEAVFEGPFAAVNAFSYNGINCHILLKKYPEHYVQSAESVSSPLPSLVCVAGRVDEAVEAVHDELERGPLPLVVPLVRTAYQQDLAGLVIRGYSLLDVGEGGAPVCLAKESEYWGGDRRPVWFVYSGMGSQWTAMGAHLMRIPVFAQAVHRCASVLAPRGVDLVEVLTSPDPSIFDNILNSFVGIAAVQIGLTDVLKTVGITPDHIIGHSVGELGCAYADGCVTAEQMVLAAYFRGLVSLQTPLVHGAMAAVGLGYNTIKSMLPEDIEVACHNGPDSCTISGPSPSVLEYVSRLTEQGVFAKMVPTSNIAYHSRYIAPAGGKLREYLEGVVPVVRRSKRWISTSVPAPRWEDPAAAYCSPQYLTNNLLSPVYFEEGCAEIGPGAVVVEVSPHGLLQAVLRRALPAALHLPLTRRNHPDNALMVLQAIGKLYMWGSAPRVSALYEAPCLPLPAHTPLLGHTLRWNRDETWSFYRHEDNKEVYTGERHVLVSVADKEYHYLAGYRLAGVNVLSPAALLVFVWETLAMTLGVPYKKLSVEFLNVQFLSEIQIPGSEVLELVIMLQRASGVFEVSIQNDAIVKGVIIQKSDFFPKALAEPQECIDLMTANDIYRLLRTRGLQNSGEFLAIEKINTDLTRGSLKWDGNWSCLLEGLLQVSGLRRKGAGVRPTRFTKLALDLTTHFRIATDQTGVDSSLPFTSYPLHNATRCLGIELVGLEMAPVISSDVGFWKQIATSGRTQPSRLDDPVQELTMLTPGEYECLMWRPAPTSTRSRVDSPLVQVHYVQLSEGDVMKFQGRQIPGSKGDRHTVFGTSYSGLTANGSRVMGVSEGCCRGVVEMDPRLTWPVPSHWTLEEAATVPQAYLHAYYSLYYRGSLTPGLSVLVTSGYSEVGLACISVCLADRCEVFTTVTHQRQKTLLMDMFPELPESNIINSRQCHVTDEILTRTQGQGVRLIINTERGHDRQLILNCAGILNVFVDLSVEDMLEGTPFGMKQLDFERNYFTAIFPHLLHHAGDRLKQELQQLIYRDIREGRINPLPHVTLDAEDVPRAFRLLATRKHPGAVVINLKPHSSVPLNAELNMPNGSALVICGRHNLGVEMVDSLIRMGMRKLLIHSSNPTSGYLQMKLSVWRENGIRVSVSSEEISSRSGCRSVWSFTSKLGPIHAVLIMRDDIVKNLDQVSRKFGKSLRHFVILTSASSEQPSLGDLESVCESRTKAGLPVKIIRCFNKTSEDNDSEAVVASEVARNLEALLHHRQAVVTYPRTTGTKPNQTTSIYEFIMDTLGWVGADTSDNGATLSQLGVELRAASALSARIRLHYGLHIPPSLLLKTSLKGLKKIGVANSSCEKKGFSMFFTPCLLPEIIAAEPLMWLPTLADDADKVIQSAEGEDYLIVVPGVEGHGAGVEHVCRRLKLRALLCQFITNTSAHTVHQLATELIQRIEKQIGLTGRFYILGVAYGCLLALEMAAQLERKGLVGKIFCLDGSPAATPAIFNHHVGDLSPLDMQNQYLAHMKLVLTGEPGPLTDGSWDEKVHKFIKTKSNSTTMEYIKLVLNAGYMRLVSLGSYRPGHIRLRSPIVLIKPRPDLCLPEDYGLGQLTCGDVKVYEVEATHADVADQLCINSIILDEVAEDILLKFEVSNHCVSYLEEV